VREEPAAVSGKHGGGDRPRHDQRALVERFEHGVAGVRIAVPEHEIARSEQGRLAADVDELPAGNQVLETDQVGVGAHDLTAGTHAPVRRGQRVDQRQLAHPVLAHLGGEARDRVRQVDGEREVCGGEGVAPGVEPDVGGERRGGPSPITRTASHLAAIPRSAAETTGPESRSDLAERFRDRTNRTTAPFERRVVDLTRRAQESLRG